MARVYVPPKRSLDGAPECPAATPSVGLDALDCLGEVAQGGFGVSVEHGRAGFVEEQVLQAGEASSLSRFEDDDAAGAVGLQDGHAGDERFGIVACVGIDDVVGTDDDDYVGRGNWG